MLFDEKKMALLKRNQNFLNFHKVVEICSCVETFFLFDLCTWYFLLVGTESIPHKIIKRKNGK
jgi:hypothetical protein